MKCTLSITLAAAFFLAASPSSGAPRRDGKTQKEIANLVQQLGNDDDQVRTGAIKRLTAYGMAALPALRDAMQGNNAKIKNQANDLIHVLIAQGTKRVNDRLNKHNAAGGAMLRPAVGSGLARAFPQHLFFVVIYRQFPLGRIPPEPFKVQNIFAMGMNHKLEHLKSNKELLKFFQANLAPAKEDESIKDIAAAWLTLAAEYYQDGFFQFAIPKDGIAVAKEGNRRKVNGKSAVVPRGGNKGEIQVTLLFTATGKLDKLTEKADIKSGIRPICQATKLLDKDPIVQKMAEKDILVMGRSAKPYLDEQRAKAGPELKKAIDRIWKRIVDEGW